VDARPVPTLGRHELRRAVAWFLALSTLAMLLVAGGAVSWSIYAARRQAVHFAVQSALGMADDLVAPYCTPGLRTGSAEAVATLDRLVDGRIRDGSVTRVNVWTATGEIIYADRSELIGHRFELSAEKVALFGTDDVYAEIIETGENEHDYSERSEKLVETYIAITDTDGQPLLFEAYFPTDELDTNARYIAQRLVPAATIAIVALQLLQLPLALALARRLDKAHRSQSRLLEYAIAASDVERRRFARELHDGVIQDLAGVGYTLGSLEQQLEDSPGPLRDTVKRISHAVRADLRALRQTMVDINPPDLTRVSLHEAINDLATSLRTAGAACDIRVGDPSGLDAPTRQLLYRAAREALRNVGQHARATRVEVSLDPQADPVLLTVRDNGVGFDPDREPPAGHLGMRLMREAVEEAGGTVTVTSVIGEHTFVTVTLPHRLPAKEGPLINVFRRGRAPY
jgi:signal transduction histidine kinase